MQNWGLSSQCTCWMVLMLHAVLNTSRQDWSCTLCSAQSEYVALCSAQLKSSLLNISPDNSCYSEILTMTWNFTLHKSIIQSDQKSPFCPEGIEDGHHFFDKAFYLQVSHGKLMSWQVNVLCIDFFYPPDERFLMRFLPKSQNISKSRGTCCRLSIEHINFLI